MIPGLGDDAGRLQQYAEDAECRIELDREIALQPKLLGSEAVALLDPAFGIASVAAHVPFAGRTRGARHRVGPAHDADDEIPAFVSAALRRGFRSEEHTS